MLALGNAADHVHVVLPHAPARAVATRVGRLSRAAHVSGVMGGDEGREVGYGPSQSEPHLSSLCSTTSPINGFTMQPLPLSSPGSNRYRSPPPAGFAPRSPEVPRTFSPGAR